MQLFFLKVLAFTVSKYCKTFWKLYLKIRTWKKLRLSELKVWFCNSTCMNVAIAASQMQAKLPARVKVDKITYWLAYRRVQIEILFVGKEHLFHLINGQTSQKSSASFQPFKFNSIDWEPALACAEKLTTRDPFSRCAERICRSFQAFWQSDGNFCSYLAGPLESRSCRRQQQCSAQFELILAVRCQTDESQPIPSW